MGAPWLQLARLVAASRPLSCSLARSALREPPMLFVALWLWLDKPWLWALFEALALTYGLWVCGARGCRRGGRGEPPTKDEPRSRQSGLCPPFWGARAEAEEAQGEGRGGRRPRARRDRCRGSRPRRWDGRLKPRQWTCPLCFRSRVRALLSPRVRADHLPRTSTAGRPAFATPPRRQTPGLPIVGPEGPRACGGGGPDWLETRGHGK